MVRCDLDRHDEKVYTRISYFKVARPKSVTGEGLFELVQDTLKHFEIQAIDHDNCKKLIGFGTDGTSANIASAGLKKILKVDILVMVSCSPFGVGC